MMKPDDFMGSAEVCETLRIDRSTLTRKVKDGQINVWGQLPGPKGPLIFERHYVQQLAAERQAASHA